MDIKFFYYPKKNKMPYGVRRNGSTCTVYHKVTGKTVGHTPCSRVNKYLGALHAAGHGKSHGHHFHASKKSHKK